jgi:hypothetical protein
VRYKIIVNPQTFPPRVRVGNRTKMDAVDEFFGSSFTEKL